MTKRRDWADEQAWRFVKEHDHLIPCDLATALARKFRLLQKIALVFAVNNPAEAKSIVSTRWATK